MWRFYFEVDWNTWYIPGAIVFGPADEWTYTSLGLNVGPFTVGIYFDGEPD